MQSRTAGNVAAAWDRVAGFARDPRVRVGMKIAGFALVTVLTYLIAHPRVFTGFAWYDDEGYMLTALDSFVDRGHLYDQVFTQYGPFYYEAWGAVFSLLGIPVTHDGGRTVTVIAWVVSSLVLGLAVARMTRSALLGMAIQVLVFSALWTLPTEPMHPGGLICLLLAGIVAVSCAVRNRPSVGAMAVLGGAVTALALVKINVGAFALIALALACTVSYAPLARRAWVRVPAEVCFVAVPFLLMSGRLGETWARDYALHVALAALAVVIVLRFLDNPRRAPEELLWLLGGAVGLAAASFLAVLASGTSVDGLIDGLIRQPLRQSDAFSLPLVLSSRLFVIDAIALAAAIAYCYVLRGERRPNPVWDSVFSLLAIFVGVQMALSTFGKSLPFDAGTLAGFQFSMLAFVWLALVPVPGGSDRATAFARLLLPLVAVLQALHGFPVAGSQVQWSVFLLAPVGALCIGNGVRGLAHSLPAGRERRGLAALATVTALALGGFVANATLREPLRDYRAAYDGGVSLDLPGARDVRLAEEEADMYRAIVRAIDADCATFVMLPGMNSFYLWTGQSPPSGFNATGWPTLFDDEHQRQVIDEVDPLPGLCLLENESLASFWSAGDVPETPLVRYMRREFRPMLEIGEYRLLRRPARPPPSAS